MTWVTRAQSRNSMLEGGVARDAVLFVAGALTYFFIRGLMDAQAERAFANAQHLIQLEQALGIAWEPALQRHILGSDALVRLVNWVYVWGHWPLIGVVALWLALCHRQRYCQLRNAMLLSGVIGLVIFASFPVAPPRLAEPGVVVDTVTLHSHAYRVLQPAAFTNPYAAMPSLHVGWNLLVGITLARTSRSRAVRLFGWLMPVAMVLAVVLTANHYLLDAVCGALIALGSLSITSRWVRPASPAAVVSPTGASLVEKEPV